MRTFYRLLSILGDLKAASRGPDAYLRRLLRKQANRHFNRTLRKVLRP